jgi:hypothetical protein
MARATARDAQIVERIECLAEPALWSEMGVPRLWRWMCDTHKKAVRFAADGADLASWLESVLEAGDPASIDVLGVDLNAAIHCANTTPDGGLLLAMKEGCSEELFDEVFGLKSGQLGKAVGRGDSEGVGDDDDAPYESDSDRPTPGFTFQREDSTSRSSAARRSSVSSVESTTSVQRHEEGRIPPEALAASRIVDLAVRRSGCDSKDVRLTVFLRRALLRLVAIIWTLSPTKALLVALDGPAPAAKFTQQRERRYRSSKSMYDAALEGGVAVVTATEGLGPLDTVEGAAVTPGPLYDPSAISPGTRLMHFVDSSVRELLLLLSSGTSELEVLSSGLREDDATLASHSLASARPPRSSLSGEDSSSTRCRPLLNPGALVVFSGAGAPGEGEHKIMALFRAWLCGGAASAREEAERWNDGRGCFGPAVADSGDALFWWENEALSADRAQGNTLAFWGPDGDALILGMSLLGRFGGEGSGAHTGESPPLREVVIGRDYDRAFKREWLKQVKEDRHSLDPDQPRRAKKHAEGDAEIAAVMEAAGLEQMPSSSKSRRRRSSAKSTEHDSEAPLMPQQVVSGEVVSERGKTWRWPSGKNVTRPMGAFVSCRSLAQRLFHVRGRRHLEAAAPSPHWALSALQAQRNVDLTVVMCVMGNDFLPRPVTVELDSHGMSDLVKAYLRVEEQFLSQGAAAEEEEAPGRREEEEEDDATDGDDAFGWGSLPWAPLVSVKGGRVQVGLRWLAGMLYPLGEDRERSALEGMLEGFARLHFSDSSDRELSLGESVSVGAGGSMGSFKERSVAREEESEPQGLESSRWVVAGRMAEWETDQSSRSDWYQEHMTGCGPVVHVRSIARGRGGEAASGVRERGPYPALMGVAKDSSPLEPAAWEDVLAVSAEAWVAGASFVGTYYLCGLWSWHFRYPFAHSPLLTDIALWCARRGGQAPDLAPEELPPLASCEDAVVAIDCPVGSPLSFAGHCVGVITPYSLHLLPPSMECALRSMLPWAPETSPSRYVPIRPRRGGALFLPREEQLLAAHKRVAAPPVELSALVGSEKDFQAWWFPDWEDIRSDDEGAHADWQVKLWVPMVDTDWAQRVGLEWERLHLEEFGDHALPKAADIAVRE